MSMTHQAGDAPLAPSTLRLAFVGAASLLFSVGLMVLVGLCGRSVVVPRFPSAAPWPPYFMSVQLSDVAVTGLAWLAVGIGGLGLMVINRVAGLVLPYTSKRLLDSVLNVLHPHPQELPKIIAFVFGAMVVQAITSFSLTQLLSKAGQRLIAEA